MAGPLDPRLIRRATATRGFLVAVALVGVATAFLVLVQARLISDAVAHVFDTHDAAGLLAPALLLLLVFAARAGLNWLNQLLAHRACAAVKSQLRTDVMAARLARPTDASNPSGTLITLVTQGLDALDGYYSKYLPQLMMAVSVPVVIGVAILTQDLESTIIIAITIPLIPLFMAFIGLATQEQVRRRFAVQTRLANHFADLVAGLPTLQVFGRARAQLRGLRITERAHRTETMKTLRLAFMSSFVLELLSTLSVALVAVSMGFRVVNGAFDLRTSLFVLILTPEVYLPIRQVGVHFHDSADGTAAAQKAFEIIEASEKDAPGGTLAAPDPAAVPVVFEDLGVRYPGADTPALAHFNCRIDPGQVVVLRGRSGGGKSTALAVLMGFQQACEGRVRVGDVDLAQISAESWRSRLAWVGQDPGMVNGTIADNVLLGHRGASREQARDALNHAGGARLDLDHVVADEGEGLSSGERRRVALARALLRIELGGARLLVLDEPTAGLDQTTEALAIGAVRRSGASALVVSHRDAVVDVADLVVEVSAPPRVPAGTPAGAGDTPAGTRPEVATVPAAPGSFSPVVGPAATRRGGGRQRPGWRSTRTQFMFGSDSHPHSLVAPAAEAETAPAVFGPGELDPRAGTVRRVAGLVRKLLDAVPRGRWRLALAVLLAFCATASSVGLMSVSGWLLSRAAEHPPVLYLLAASVGVRFFGIGRAVWRYVERLVGHDLALRMEGSLRETVYGKLTGTTLLGRHRGDLLVRATADVDAVMDVVVRVVVPFASSVLVIIGTAVMLAVFCPAAAVVVLVMSLLAGLVLPWWGARLSLRSDQLAVPLRGRLADQVRQLARCAPELVAYGAGDEGLAALRRTDAELSATEARGAWTRGIASAGQMLACGLSVVGALLVGAPAVASGAMLGRVLALVVLTPLALHESFGDLGQAAQTFTRARAALDRVIALLVEPAVGHGDRVSAPSAGAGELELDHVDAGWPGGPVVVSDVSLQLPPGERLALIGTSGVGKTTLAATIMGLIDPLAGTVHAPGSIAYLAQDAHIFATSVAENVRIGDKDADDSRVREALDLAGLGGLALTREVGEEGATLSGGEARRLALARILVGRVREQLVILDEPTEHLDHETAEAIMSDLWAGVGDAAVLVITHDPELIAACPAVLDLDGHRAGAPTAGRGPGGNPRHDAGEQG